MKTIIKIINKYKKEVKLYIYCLKLIAVCEIDITMVNYILN